MTNSGTRARGSSSTRKRTAEVAVVECQPRCQGIKRPGDSPADAAASASDHRSSECRDHILQVPAPLIIAHILPPSLSARPARPPKWKAPAFFPSSGDAGLLDYLNRDAGGRAMRRLRDRSRVLRSPHCYWPVVALQICTLLAPEVPDWLLPPPAAQALIAFNNAFRLPWPSAGTRLWVEEPIVLI